MTNLNTLEILSRLLGSFISFVKILFEIKYTGVLLVNKKKNFADFQQKIRGFSKFSKIEFWWRQIFENLIIHKPFLGSHDVPQKIWARSVQPFWRLLDTNRQTDKQTNRQTDRQAKFIYRLWKIYSTKYIHF